MCYWILSAIAVPIVQSTVQAILTDELTQEDLQQTIKAFDIKIIEKLGEPVSDPSLHKYKSRNRWVT
jgi:hypothetical protein